MVYKLRLSVSLLSLVKLAFQMVAWFLLKIKGIERQGRGRKGEGENCE